MYELNESVVVDYLAGHVPGLRAVYLYGSRAYGQARPDSDVDLAVMTDFPITLARRSELKEALALRLNRDVDFIDLRDASTVMRMEVIAKGRRLFGHGDEIESFEDRAYSQYARLNEERSAILGDIQARGSVYG